MGGMPGVVGLVDCTHARIQCPSDNEADYVNRRVYIRLMCSVLLIIYYDLSTLKHVGQEVRMIPLF